VFSYSLNTKGEITYLVKFLMDELWSVDDEGDECTDEHWKSANRDELLHYILRLDPHKVWLVINDDPNGV
jgi:hypothetical protein